jgi:hypothetical protein
MTRFLLLSDSCGFLDLGRPLWRADLSVVYNCCWSSPAQSFSGPSPVGLATVFYCLIFDTYLFVASCDSQGYGGGFRTRLHTGGILQKKKIPHYWKFSKVHTGSRLLHASQTSIHILLCDKIMQATSRSHTNSWKWKCSQHWTRRILIHEI